MADPVKPRRRYESPRRREQAAATRAQILEAAQRLFERDGYVADHDGRDGRRGRRGAQDRVPRLRHEARAAPRDLGPAAARPGRSPVADLPWYREVLEEPDPVRQLRLNARNSRSGKERIGGVLRVIRTRPPPIADMAALWQPIQTDFYDEPAGDRRGAGRARSAAAGPRRDDARPTSCGRSTTPTSGGCSSSSGGGRPTSTSGGSARRPASSSSGRAWPPAAERGVSRERGGGGANWRGASACHEPEHRLRRFELEAARCRGRRRPRGARPRRTQRPGPGRSPDRTW